MLITVTEVKTYDCFTDLLINSWGGAIAVLKELQQKGLEKEVMITISEYADCFADDLTTTELNDFIWFNLKDQMVSWGYLEAEQDGDDND